MIKVATGGCFDILHVGHIDLLQRASFIGPLTIFLNSDESIKRIKGKNRPIIPLDQRRTILHNLSMVDRVLVFDEDTPIDIISEYKPEIWVKGGDYKKEDLPETPIVESYGGKVIIIHKKINVSTTEIIERIKRIG